MTTPVLEVFADIACPFTHVGLARLVAFRASRPPGAGPMLRVRAWPLELVNGQPLRGAELVPKIEALRASVAPDLFSGFDPDRFPTTTLPALAAEAAAGRAGLEAGEAFSLAIRAALFEQGRDIGDPAVVLAVLDELGLAHPDDTDRAQVEADLAEGRRRGVVGSPHFFGPRGDFFCPSLDIHHDDAGYHISFDHEGFDSFVAAIAS